MAKRRKRDVIGLRQSKQNAARDAKDAMAKAPLSAFLSWPVLLFVFVLFFPLGIALIYARFRADKLHYPQNAYIVQIWGVVLLCFAAIYTFVWLAGNFKTKSGTPPSFASVFTILLVMASGGVWLLCLARNMRRKGNRFAAYPSLIYKQNRTEWETLSAVLDTPVKTVLADLQEMLRAGLLPDVFLDMQTREICRADVQIDVATKRTSLQTLVCPCCGAVNTIAAEGTAACEYCGSSISF